MKAFLYLRDRLFLVCCLLYAANRWLIKPRTHNVFIHGYFNDVLLIPCALPPLLLMYRWAGLRQEDCPPTAGDIALNLVVWSIFFEIIAPRFTRRATGDPWDVVAYMVGGILAGLWWHRRRFRGSLLG